MPSNAPHQCLTVKASEYGIPTSLCGFGSILLTNSVGAVSCPRCLILLDFAFERGLQLVERPGKQFPTVFEWQKHGTVLKRIRLSRGDRTLRDKGTATINPWYFMYFWREQIEFRALRRRLKWHND